jgi:hypothetical protein
MRWTVLAIAAACATVGATACDALVDPGYSGEPLIRLQGVVSSTRGDVTPTGAKGAALWQAASLQGLTDFTRLPLRVDFPVFRIDVIAPPREEALFHVDPGEPAIAEAYLHIVKPDTASMARADDFLATDYEHALIYVTGELSQGGATALYLGMAGAVAPGFHVVTRSSVDVEHGEMLRPSQQALAERCVALAPTGPPGRAHDSCFEQRRYRLDPTPDDLATLLQFRVELPGT